MRTAAYWAKASAYLGTRPTFDNLKASCFARFLSNSSHPWIMLVGDSNTRGLFNVLVDTWLACGFFGIARANKSAPRSWDKRWFDDDAIFIVSGRRLRLSMRFMWNPNERLKRWNSVRSSGGSWYSAIQQCGRPSCKCLEAAQSAEFSDSLWDKGPGVVVLSHGLWTLPTAEQVGMACKARRRTGQLLMDLGLNLYSSLTPRRFLWTSNFHINHHMQIRNADIDADVRCQRQVAEEICVEVLDLSALHPQLDGIDFGFHLEPKAQGTVLGEIVHHLAMACDGPFGVENDTDAAAGTGVSADLAEESASATDRAE